MKKFNEFISKNVSSFIPFKLRTKKISVEEFRKKGLSLENNYILKDNKYQIKLEKLLIGKVVNFTAYNYTNEKSFEVESFYIRKINFNQFGVILLIGYESTPNVNASTHEDEFGHRTDLWSFALQETIPIYIDEYKTKERLEREIELKKIDPYGEEEWG